MLPLKLRSSCYTWISVVPCACKVLVARDTCSLLSMTTRDSHGQFFFARRTREKGITHNFSAPYTPQQNGVVERKNRTLQDMSRTMLLSSGLAPTYWAEAVNTACYIINRAMPRPMLDKTPYELIKGMPPNISHLRTFGCKCFVHNNGKDNLGKFDPRSDEARNCAPQIGANKETGDPIERHHEPLWEKNYLLRGK